MESSSFYITCPSNASMQFYPNNNQSSFKINLPKRLYLTNKYEVGLAEIQYPVNWRSFSTNVDLSSYFYDEKREIRRFYVKNITLNHIDELLHVLRVEIRRLFRDDRKNPVAQIKYDRVTDRIQYSIKEKCELQLSQEINEALGFERTTILSGLGVSKYAPDVRRGLNSFFIYCNLVDSQIVGDVYAPLLRTIGIRGKRGEVITQTFDRPHYVPVNTDEVNVIEINIKDDAGEDISFQSGKVLCKLHFRQKLI